MQLFQTLFQKKNLNLDMFHSCSATILVLLSHVVLVRKIAYDISRRHDVGTCTTIPCRQPRYFLVPVRFRRMRDSETKSLVGWRLKGMQFSKPANHFHSLYAHVTFFPPSSHSSVTFNRLLARILNNSAQNVICSALNCIVWF